VRHGETPKTWRYLEVQFQVIPKWISGYGGFPLKGVSQNYPGQKNVLVLKTFLSGSTISRNCHIEP
jgi:hypothetical protein